MIPVFAAVLLTGSLSGAALAAEGPQATTPSVKPAKGLDAAKLQTKVAGRLASAKGAVTAFVELEAKPAVDTFTEKTGQGASKQQAKEAAKATKGETTKVTDQVVGDLRAKDSGTKELFRTANGVPGVVVTADAAKVRELASRSDVKSIRTVVPKTRTNSSAVQLTNTAKAWQQYGKLGDGTRVGIIDTGIDYTHAAFAGPGTPEAYRAVDPNVVDASYFPTAKVVGGYDFVGDAYDGGSDDPALSTPKPDPNPLDCNDHGTHVAGTAAGFGVNADGSTFTGDYTTLSGEQLDAMRIGPGTAPKALLYALKVFGCDGSTNVTAQALDWALDPDGDGDFTDHLDVVNLSLGSDYGAPDDPDSLFVRKLNAAGVLTVFSAGNGGDLYDIGGSPGSTPEALTVASTRDAFVLRDAAEANGAKQAGQYSQNFDYAGYDQTKPVLALTDPSNLDGCQPFSAADAAAVAGKFVWLEWDDVDATRRCGSGARANNATAAGAVGALFTSALENFNAGIAGNAAIPVFQFTGTATSALRPALAAGALSVRQAGDLRTSLPTYDQKIADTPSAFTSRGVRGPVVKPDVAAPGDTIASALVGSGNGTLVISGTSMAAPHTTGIAALVRQAHPDWTTEEVKAAVMNSAGSDVEENGKTFAPNRVGAGRIDAKAALDNQVLAYVQDDPGAVSASFGPVEVTGKTALTKTIKVVNKSPRAVEYSVGYEAVTSIPGVRYELSEQTVRLSPRGIARVKVTLRVDDPKALAKTVDPTVEPLHLDVPRQFLADASGRVVLSPKSGATVPLRVPVYSAPKPASDISVPGSVKLGKNATQTVLNLTGRGVDQKGFRSLVSVLELQATSPRLPECKRNVTSGCTLNQTAKGADLRHVGVTSTAPLAKLQGNPEEALLAFGVSTWDNWYNLGSNTIFYIDVDVNGDGNPDFETYTTKLTDTDLLVAVTVDLATGETVDIQPVNAQFGDVDTNVFDTNVVVLPVLLSALGIDPSGDTAKITYTVNSTGFYLAPGASDDRIDSIDGALSFDALKPGLWVQGGGDAALSYQAKPGTALVVNREPGTASDSLMVVNHHNASGDRVDVVKVKGGSDRPAV